MVYLTVTNLPLIKHGNYLLTYTEPRAGLHFGHGAIPLSKEFAQVAQRARQLRKELYKFDNDNYRKFG